MSKPEVNIFFAPVSSGDLFLNFEKSVLNGIPKSEIAPSFQPQFRKADKRVLLWGIRDAKKTTYDKTQKNDFVLFYKNGFIVGYSKVYSLFVSEALAKTIWGIFENKQREEKYSWCNIIVFADYKTCLIPFSKFNKIGGYSDKFSVRGYLKYREIAVDKIIKEFGSIETFIEKQK